MPLLPWIDMDNFNPATDARHAPAAESAATSRSGAKHTEDYWTEKDDHPRSTSTTRRSSTSKPPGPAFPLQFAGTVCALSKQTRLD